MCFSDLILTYLETKFQTFTFTRQLTSFFNEKSVLDSDYKSLPNYFCTLSELNVMFLILKSHKRNIYYISHHGCEVVPDYKKPQTIHFFVSWKTNFSKGFCLKLCFFNFFTFEFNIFTNKTQEAKHWHLSNGLRLKSQTVHFLFHEKQTALECFRMFFLFILFEFNILINKISETKHSHL